MKIIACILATLVITLSCMPCADFASACEMSAVENNDPVNEDEQHSDTCSPFCHCACCSGFSVNHFNVTVIPVKLFLRKPVTCFLSSVSTGVFFAFWQPPRYG